MTLLQLCLLSLLALTAFLSSTVTLSAPLGNGVNYTSCGGPLTAGQYVYDISSLNGRVVQANENTNGYKITLCESGIDKCGLCDNAGYCEIEQWYDNCVGKFSAVEALDNGNGLFLYYPNGEFGRRGVVYLLCDPNSPAIGPVLMQNSGNLAVINSSLACGVHVSPCAAYGSNCTSCLGQPSCAFCLDTNQCIGGNQTCSDYIKSPQLCSKVDPCGSQTTCAYCPQCTFSVPCSSQ